MALKDYSNHTKEQLLEIIEQFETNKKYGLVWDEEKILEQVVADCQNSIPVLLEITEKAVFDHQSKTTHILIEGDNYHALMVLAQTHHEKIDLIYIDPPYNTGKANEFMYNDKYVDINDGYRHSKWLSFMSKRLELAKGLLTEKGVIFMSIDDNEIAQLKLLCNQVFGEENFIAQFIRKNKAGAGHDSGQIAIEFDYMLCFAKNKSKVKFQKEILDVENDLKYKLEDNHVLHRGKYYLRDLDYKGTYSPSGDYGMTTPDGTRIFSGSKLGKPNTWRWSKEKVAWGIENDYIVFKKNKENWKVYIKQYQFVDNENNKRERQLPYRALIQFLNSDGSQELNNVVEQNIFKFPKSTALIEFCLNLIPNKNCTVLDFFAGSGTTGHAVLVANKKDNGNRKFIICTNNENNICENVTYQRIGKAIKGYKNLKGKHIEGTGNNLKYYKTAFVYNDDDNVRYKENIIARCTELLCLKESAFDLITGNNAYKIYKNQLTHLIIFYGISNASFEQFKNEIHALQGAKKLYCFSASHCSDISFFASCNIKKLETIPQKILALYNQIF